MAPSEAEQPQESPHPPPVVPCAAALPNVGNEGHSYLHHAAVRHGSLAPLTLFLPDTLWDDATLAKPHFAHDVVVRGAVTRRTRARPTRACCGRLCATRR